MAVCVASSLRAAIVGRSEERTVYARSPEYMLVRLQVGFVKMLLAIVYSPPKCGYSSDVEDALLGRGVAYDFLLLKISTLIEGCIRLATYAICGTSIGVLC